MSRLHKKAPGLAMKTQTRPAQAESDMSALTNILVPLDVPPPSGTAPSKQRMMEPTAESIAARLARHPFLAGMNRSQLAMLADCARAVQFQRGHFIFREGDVADRFYLIETGKVNLESSGGLGDPMLGWSWMFPPHIWTFTARAVEPTTAIFFDGASLQESCEKDHSFGYEFLKRMNLVMYQRMQATRNKIQDLHRRRDLVHRRSAALAYGGARFLAPECSKVA
jgi:signal-transduction protein with cAMP-binding, CBS, and nucleotidyltransferase domain